MEVQQSRVILWANPRSLSTVFEKWISFLPKVQIVNEPYAMAHDIGPEKVKLPDEINAQVKDKWFQLIGDHNATDGGYYAKAFEGKECSFKFVKDLLEQKYSDKLLVFCKDLVYGVYGRFELLPKGYKHTFLIRNPYRMMLSWRKLMESWFAESDSGEFNIRDADALFPALNGYKMLWELIEHIKGQDDIPIVIDSDDLQSDPGSILKQFCEKIGMAYQESMLQWNAGRDVMRDWISARSLFVGDHTAGYYSTAMESTSFLPLKSAPTRQDMPSDLLEYIDANMPFYLKMHAMRISC